MKKFVFFTCLSFLLIITSSIYVTANDDLAKADELFNKGGINNYKQAIELCIKTIEKQPNNYEAHWKCSRVCREYAEEAMIENITGWKNICVEYGKKGMEYAEKAKDIEPKRPDAFYYYGLSVGVYSNGVGTVNAIKEGLKNKLIESLETAYDFDKTYMDGGPPIALGRFWAKVPWPFKDKKKALKYFREYQSLAKYKILPDPRRIYIAELLIEFGDEDSKKEAKSILEIVAKSEIKYYKDLAINLLSNLK